MRLFLAFLLSFLTAFGPVMALAATTRTINTQQADGGASIERNYIQNSNAITNTAGWVTYADGSSYVDGTGGSPTATWTRSTSSPISGDANFVFTPGTLGDGVSYTVALDSKKQGMWIPISFDYQFTGTTPSDGDVQVMVYDVTNSKIIQPAPYKVPALVAGVNNTFVSGFQAASNSTSYRVSLYQSTSTSTYTLKGVNFRAGGQKPTLGLVGTDWVSYTPTFSAGWGTPTAVVFYWRRNGPNVEVNGTMAVGSSTTSGGTMTLPSGQTIASTAVGADSVQQVGEFSTSQGSNATGYPASSNGPWVIYTNLASSTSTVFFSTGTSSGVWANTNVSNYAASGYKVSVHFSVPVSGWSSNLILGSDADTRVFAAASASTPTSAAFNNSAYLIYPTMSFDTSASYSTSTGLYTAPSPGYFTFAGDFGLTGSSAGTVCDLNIYVNGSSAYIFNPSSLATGEQFVSFNRTIKLNAGDTVGFRWNTDKSSAAVSGGSTKNNLSISKVSGPSTIAASETVSGRYFAASATITGSFSTLTYSTKDFDSHSAYSAGTLTIPSAGKYQFNAFMQFSAVTMTTGTNQSIAIFKNGTQMDQTNYVNTGTDSGNGVTLQVSDVIGCLAGDTIVVKVLSGATTPTVSASNFSNVFSWAKVAN